ncbi:hypothetical protein BCAR13_360051 [Paraburkholderia caribensis]|nr:hypothetical protein BCAR13_360051 [Paraburkholderia caribensis]
MTCCKQSKGVRKSREIFAFAQASVLYSAPHWGVAAPRHARATDQLLAGERSVRDLRGRLSTDLAVWPWQTQPLAWRDR